MRRMCPSHPSHPYGDCGICDRLISEEEGRSLWAEDEADREADRYEAWLDRSAP